MLINLFNDQNKNCTLFRRELHLNQSMLFHVMLNNLCIN